MLNYKLSFEFLFKYIEDNKLNDRSVTREGNYHSFPLKKQNFRMMSKREFCDIATAYDVPLHVILTPHVISCSDDVRERVYNSVSKTYRQLKKSYPISKDMPVSELVVA
jgi:hypothetical protein